MNLFRLKPALLPLLLFWQMVPQPAAPFSHFRYQRVVTLSVDTGAGETCAVLDADLFAHAAAGLKDLRLYSGRTEIPYITTVSEPQQQDSDDARIFNLHSQISGQISGQTSDQTRRIVFDLEMPRRPYTGVTLDLAAHDYIATAIVSGSAAAGGREAVALGTFTLFDLTSQHLSRDTDIPLPESSFPYLHIELSLISVSPNGLATAALNLSSSIKAAVVPPSRESQSLYTTIQAAASPVQTGQDRVAAFDVPARVPIERVAFAVPTGYSASFSRSVRIMARAGMHDDPGDDAASSQENAVGTILRVRKSVDGHALSAESLTVPVAIGSNMQQAARVEVHVENGPDPSLPLTVRLEMRQRRICFAAADPHLPLMLFYGDPSLDAPSVAPGIARVFDPAATPRIALLGPETQNAGFTATPSPRRLMGQRPVLRWIAILGCVCIFALLVIRSSHRRRRRN